MALETQSFKKGGLSWGEYIVSHMHCSGMRGCLALEWCLVREVSQRRDPAILLWYTNILIHCKPYATVCDVYCLVKCCQNCKNIFQFLFDFQLWTMKFTGSLNLPSGMGKGHFYFLLYYLSIKYITFPLQNHILHMNMFRLCEADAKVITHVTMYHRLR